MDSSKVLSNLIWRFLERCGAQGVTFIVSIILARLLNPTVYGTIALVTVFTSILQVFVDSGLGNALIQKKNADNLDFSTVFYFNMFVCILLYLIIYFISPLIANFYKIDGLVNIIRVLGLTFIISGLKNVQQAYVSRNMMFKRFFFSTLAGTIGAAIIGITLAYLGFGVWSLVIQHIFNLLIDTCVLWVTVKWRPICAFSFNRLKKLYSFGWKLLVSSLIDNIYNNIRQLIIGKMYSADSLAQYNRGKQFPYLISININSSIDSVLFPALSRVQENPYQIKMITRRSIKTSVFIMAPLMIGLAFLSKNIVVIILTEKWLPCVPFMQIFCITYMFQPIQTANQNAIKAMGRSDLFLKLNIAQRIVGIILLVSTMWFGVMAMAYSLLISNVLCQIIIAWPNKILLDYSYTEQLKDIFPSILIAIIMGVCVLIINFIQINVIFKLIIQIIFGASIYIGISYFFRIDSFKYIVELLKKFIKHN